MTIFAKPGLMPGNGKGTAASTSDRPTAAAANCATRWSSGVLISLIRRLNAGLLAMCTAVSDKSAVRPTSCVAHASSARATREIVGLLAQPTGLLATFSASHLTVPRSLAREK